MTYSPESQVVARQLDYFTDKNVLLAGELEDSFANEIAGSAKSVTVFTTNLGFANQMQAFSKVKVLFDACYRDEQPIDILLFFWPKAKAEAQFLLSMLMAKLGQGVEVALVGENRSGVKSAEKLFAPYGKLVKYDSARRCSFYFGECEHIPSAFNLDDWYKTYELTIEGKTLTVKSLPGVFSYGELDKGTELLLANLSDLQGEVLDFGCGAGVIGATIKQRFPECQINMADISALAVLSAKGTLSANGFSGNVFASDVYSNIEKSFDHIISNPPFHAGLKTHYASTESMLENAPRYLKAGGSLTIVANSFLQYPPIIERAFKQCSVLAKNNKFALYHAKKSNSNH